MNTTSPVALVTGAGSGIGKETALRLAREGYHLALAGRNLVHLHAVAGAAGVPTRIIHADLAEPELAVAMVDQCVAHFGRLDALVNNAGWSPAATIRDTSVAIARQVFAVNAISPAVAIARAWLTFERQHAATGVGGVIVSVSSIASIDPFDILYAYGAAKAGVNNLTISAARQGAAIGVRAFCVAPGAVETDLLRTIVSKENLPPDKTLRPADVAGVIVDCVRGRRDADNGSTIFLRSPA